MKISDLQKKIREFVRLRDWEKYHDPKNLTMALAGEVGELLEIFQWLSPKEAKQVMKDPVTAKQVRHELADIFVYLLRLSDKLQVSLEEAVQEKLIHNQKKYPVHLSKGVATKYNRLKTK
ncbi:nucleotide pyrophosphohydrolase [bacterium]|nr:nucleotide pyrophosphohydrolase [bacterium]